MYHAIPSAKKQKERKRKLIIRWSLSFLCFVSLFSLTVWTLSEPSLQVKKIEVTGNKVLSVDEVRNIAQKDISGKYLFLFPKSSAFLFPRKAIRRDVLSAFPRLSSLEITLKKNTVLLSLTERDSAGIWCGIEKDASTPDGCFYMDSTGYLFDQSPSFSGDVYFKFYGKGILKEGNPVGHNFISSDLFQKISEIRTMLEKYDKKTSELYLGEDSRAELTAESGCKIGWSTDQSFLPLKSNMEAVFKSSEWGKDISGKDKCAELEYIDFRFGNKIYYRQKGFESSPIAPAEIIKTTGTTTPTT
ncbi:MAG: hypothetical protein NT098_04415 [Candidatus Parcubacteria bacterium]|nr:hypothetical protein [Candidatus Parcubacteria bacterium]